MTDTMQAHPEHSEPPLMMNATAAARRMGPPWNARRLKQGVWSEGWPCTRGPKREVMFTERDLADIVELRRNSRTEDRPTSRSSRRQKSA